MHVRCKAALAGEFMEFCIDSLSARIRVARVSSGLSQTELSKALKVNRSTVGHWERKFGFVPSIEHLSELGRITRVSVSWLISGDSVAAGGMPEGTRHLLEASMLTTSRNLPISFLNSIVELMRSAERHL
jgi:HTH-type transcriptional regulator, cell division transcriptional repressor